MIVTPRISLRKLLRFTWPRLLILVIFTALACVAMNQLPRELLTALSYAAGFLGTAVAFLIGFRNNSAYGRWWEAHRIWSKLKYDSRSFSLMLQSLLDDGQDTSARLQRMIHRQIAFAWRLNRFLRKLPSGAEESELLCDEEHAIVEARHNPPLAILDLQNRDLRELFRSGALDSVRMARMSEMITAFNEVLSSSERLKKTPFPMQYTWFMNYTLTVFLFVLPLSLAGHLGYWSVPFSLAIGYAFVMLEYVGRYIEHPFENEVNDVPLDYIARTIEIDLRELLGETDLPPVIKPKGLGYLY